MKEFTLKRDSWHYKLVTFGDRESETKLKYEVDMCEYVWMVIRSFALWAFFAVVAVSLAFGVIQSLYDLVQYIFFGKEFIEKGTVVFLVFMVGFAVFAGIIVFLAWRETVVNDLDYKPGFVTLAYRKFKDKTCSRINFE
jgi:hypothetical protein